MVFGGLLAFCQTPQSFNYQSVIRNSDGGLVTNQQVGIQITILQGSSSGMVVYSESHTPLTNANGLATINIGEGTPSVGVFGSINWGNGPYFVETSTDPNGGTNYSVSSISQLLSVPFALHSAVADSIAGIKPVSAETSMKMVSGFVKANGEIIEGAGFVVTPLQPSGGSYPLNQFRYEIQFDNPFQTIPALLFSRQLEEFPYDNSQTFPWGQSMSVTPPWNLGDIMILRESSDNNTVQFVVTTPGDFTGRLGDFGFVAIGRID